MVLIILKTNIKKINNNAPKKIKQDLFLLVSLEIRVISQSRKVVIYCLKQCFSYVSPLGLRSDVASFSWRSILVSILPFLHSILFLDFLHILQA